MVESQELGSNTSFFQKFFEVLSQFYFAVERVRNHLTTPAQFSTTSEKRRSFSIKFLILQLTPLFEELTKYRSAFPELSLHELILNWQLVFWMAEHHQLDSIFEYFFKAYKRLKEFYEALGK